MALTNLILRQSEKSRIFENIFRMKIQKTVLGLLACFVVLHVFAVKPRQTKVYMFGFGTSFLDSVAFVTDIQLVDSVTIDDQTKFLQDRALYGIQLQTYFKDSMQKENMTCVVFFNEKKKKVEKQYSKICKKYRANPSLQFSILNTNVFKFHPEEYVEPVVSEKEATDKGKKSKGKKSKKQKS